MKIQTFSIVVGTQACDAHCPFCISHTTGFDNLPKNPGINHENLHKNLNKAILLAKMSGTTTVLLTGKGEPTLYPDEIYFYLYQLKDQFPFVELQTNAIQIGYLAERKGERIRSRSQNAHVQPDVGVEKYSQYVRLTQENLQEWNEFGLNTIAISTVGINLENNQTIYREYYPNLSRTVKYLHDLGYSIRLCVMMMNGMVDTPDEVREVVKWCKKEGVEQLTIRPIRRPNPTRLAILNQTPEDEFVGIHGLQIDQERAIRNSIERDATRIMTLMNGAHEARVYDYDGQNICVSDCLTVEPSSDEIRTLIFFGNGTLFYGWQYEGARLL